MKIISLNTWGGIAGEKDLIDFFKRNKAVDVFCLQEVFNGGKGDATEKSEKIESKVYNLLSQVKDVLPNHECYFRPHLKDHYGLAIFIKKDIVVLEEGEQFVHKEKGYMPTGNMGYHARNVQYMKINSTGGNIYIINFHGLWNGMGKTDTEDRLAQSKNIIRFIQDLQANVVLCGDFNLRPDTESLRMIPRELHLRNLIEEYEIQSTRTSYYTKSEKFADYIFVAPTIKVKDFRVLPDEVSDHAPLLLEIQ